MDVFVKAPKNKSCKCSKTSVLINKPKLFTQKLSIGKTDGGTKILLHHTHTHRLYVYNKYVARAFSKQ